MQRKAILGIIAGLALGLLSLGTCGCSKSVGTAPSPLEYAELPPVDFDLTGRTVAELQPGLVVADHAPEGWTHLVLKSQPQVAAESRPASSATTLQMVSMTKTVFTAKVDRLSHENNAEHVLVQVGLGIAAEIDGKDTVVTAATATSHGMAGGMIESTVLAGAEDFLKQARCIARSSRMAIVDMPVNLLHDGKHRPAVFRYLLLVDPANGDLVTTVWPISAGKDERKVIGQARQLPNNCVDDCPIHIDRKAYILGVPTAAAYATMRPPVGQRSFDLPEDLLAPAAAAVLTNDSAAALESGLRRMLAGK